MATAERREARRRKLLQNPEDRLQRILGSRLNHPTTSRSQFEPSESLLNSASTEKQDVSNEKKLVTDPKPSENITVEKDVLSVTKDVEDQTDDRKTTEETVCESQDIETDRGNYLDNEFKDVPEATSLSQNPCTVPSPPVAGVNETVEHVSLGSKSGIWTRVIFNVTLAFVLSMIWPFLALQLLFVCVPSFRQTSHSAYISMLTVALQLCSIPIEFTHKVNFILTALLAAFKDFGVFLFSVIVIYCAVEYSITTGLLKYVLSTID